MTPDDFKQAWKTQSSGIRLSIDPEMLDAEARRFQKQFRTVLFWRDLRELGTALLLIPLWLFLGQKLTLPWTWYLMVPVLVWIAGYMLIHRMRHKPRPADPGEALCRRLERNLAQVEGQIRLLKNVLWWCLLPMAVPMLAFVGHVAWLDGQRGWETAFFASVIVLVLGVVFFAVRRINQSAVRADLVPRRDEFRTQLLSLQEESAESDS